MIWRLEYENAHGDVARLDIQRGASTPVEIIEGTENPFLLSYELEDKNKKGFIMSSFADISLYETATFNIDDLKTLDETAISVKWYINGVLEWTGFVVPDFFSRTIGEPAIVNLAASDRLSSLKNATLDGLSEYVKLKDLAIACLAKTGLSLPLITTVDFTERASKNVMDAFALSERLEDDKGKKISCFDVLRSILVLTNSTIRQRKGQWRIYNKIQHEALTPSLNFNEVYQGAKRTIQPVFSSVGAFQEFGGGKRYPRNNDFQLATGWTAKNGFVFARENREVIGYTVTGVASEPTCTPIYGDATDNYRLANNNDIVKRNPTDITGSPYLESTIGRVPYDKGSAKINIDLNAVAPNVNVLLNPPYRTGAAIYYAVIAENPTETLILNNDGAFVPIANGANNFQKFEFIPSDEEEMTAAISKGGSITATLDIGSSEYYNIRVRIYGSGSTVTTFLDSISFSFSLEQDIGKGVLYRTDQIGSFSKKSNPDTTIFGDYISSGLNGYFYPYAKDDTSALRRFEHDDYPTSKWTTATDPTAGELPILQHVTRQMSRMFGVAHNVLSAVIDAKTFDPLAIVTNCAGEKYVIVYSVFDFLRSTVEVELQQIAYGTLQRRDFIFSYFGGGDGDGISSIGSVSGGGSSSGGGGSFLDKYFSFDEANDALVANVNLVSEKEIAAYFADGSIPSIFDNFPFATSESAGGIKAASTFQNGIRINSSGFLEVDPSYADSGVSSWNDLTNRPTWLTPTTKELFEAGHGHTWSQITSKPTAFTPTTHTHTPSQVGLGNVGNYSDYARKGQNETITGGWDFRRTTIIRSPSNANTPTLGSSVSTSLLALNSGGQYGLLFGVSGTGRSWIQGGRIDGSVSTYDIQLQPSGGNVGIGLSGNAPATEKLHVVGNGLFTGNLTANNGTFNGLMKVTHLSPRYEFHQTDVQNACRWVLDNDLIQMQVIEYGTSLFSHTPFTISLNAPTGSFRVNSTGSVTTGSDLYVGGNITAQGEVTAYSSSDQRLKKNIKTIESAIDTINKLNPVSFNWNEKAIDLNSAKDSDRVNYGVIAQEIERVLPELVHQTNGYKSVDYIQLIGVLLGAVKELNNKITRLENK